MKLNKEHLDSLSERLIPILDRVSMPKNQESDDFVENEKGFHLSREAEQLVWAIEGQALMVTSTPAPLRDGSYRIVLSPSKNWDVQSMMMSGLDSSTEIVLILAPKI